MHNREELLEETKREFCRSYKLWNPHLLSVDNETFAIPLQAGVTAEITLQNITGRYELHTLITTVGDIEVDETEMYEFIKEAIDDVIPAYNSNLMTNLIVSVSHDDLDEYTETVEVHTQFGDNPLEINVPNQIEDSKSYAESVAEYAIKYNLKHVVRETTDGKSVIEPNVSTEV